MNPYSGGLAPAGAHLHRPDVRSFYDPRTSSIQYVVSDADTRCCANIDPVLDYDEKSGATATINADAILDYVAERDLRVEWIPDTHPHADHFSAAQYLKERTGAPTAIGERIVEVQRLWKSIYNWSDLATDGSQWDKLFAAGEEFRVGSLVGRVLCSPGHTLASVGLAYNPGSQAGVRSMAIARQPLHILFAPGHALHTRRRMSLKAAAAERSALLTGDHGIRQLLARVEADQGFHLVPHLEAGSIDIVRRFAMSGRGVTFLPVFAAAGSSPSLSRIHCSRKPVRTCLCDPSDACPASWSIWSRISLRACGLSPPPAGRRLRQVAAPERSDRCSTGNGRSPYGVCRQRLNA